jgi:hypothetical protein
MRNCKECQADISGQASACPRCGCPELNAADVGSVVALVVFGVPILLTVVAVLWLIF